MDSTMLVPALTPDASPALAQLRHQHVWRASELAVPGQRPALPDMRHWTVNYRAMAVPVPLLSN